MKPALCSIALGLLALAGLPVLAQAPNSTPTHSFAARGAIIKIAPDHRQVTIHHETIPGYMMEMTMDFTVDHPDELKGFVPGDKITFTLNVNNDRSWITDVKRIGHTDAAPSGAMKGMPGMSGDVTPRLNPGEPMPDGDLIAEDGRHLHLSAFHGRVVALTFFFTRCPLPDYCPLMNKNFAATRALLLADPKAPKNWEFLSISFDSAFDQPATLAGYADFYRDKNPDRWLFAAAPPATLAALAPPTGLLIMRQGESLSHNLRTLVLDPHGRLAHQFNDNRWTPRQLADAMIAAAKA
jgi:protein SCO1/2